MTYTIQVTSKETRLIRSTGDGLVVDRATSDKGIEKLYETQDRWNELLKIEHIRIMNHEATIHRLNNQ